MAAFAQRAVRRLRCRRGGRANARSASSRETRGRSTPSPTSSSAKAACARVLRACKPSSRCLRPAGGRSIRTMPGTLRCSTSRSSTSPATMRVFRDAYLGHHPGFRGRATRRDRVAMAHRDGRHPDGRGMAVHRRACRAARDRNVHAVHERALRLCARARRPRRCAGGGARQRAQAQRSRRRGSKARMGAGRARGGRSGGRVRRRRPRARRRICSIR